MICIVSTSAKGYIQITSQAKKMQFFISRKGTKATKKKAPRNEIVLNIELSNIRNLREKNQSLKPFKGTLSFNNGYSQKDTLVTKYYKTDGFHHFNIRKNEHKQLPNKHLPKNMTEHYQSSSIIFSTMTVFVNQYHF